MLKRKGFECCNCGQSVPFSGFIGTEHRNHCPSCLWSKHVDLRSPGDRKAGCQAGMKPIGLTFKQEGTDRYGMPRQGELMLIHECAKCGKISINRIAGDDNPEEILKILEESRRLSSEKRDRLKRNGIGVILQGEREKIITQLFGRDSGKV